MISVMIKRTVIAVAVLSAGCAVHSMELQRNYLSEEGTVDLIENPQKWDGQTVTVRVYPYDNGFRSSYLICFDPCSREVAERSPFIVYTTEDKYRGYEGNQPVIMTARYSSACFYRNTLCPDMRFGQFTETPSP
jgi:hypothetical protein